MMKFCAMLMAIAACTSMPAYGGQEDKAFDSKECMSRCKDYYTPKMLGKDADYLAFQSDPTRSDAEKARNEKEALKKLCRKSCLVE